MIGEGQVAVIDPGPDDPAHLEALKEALKHETVTHILITHTHRDHSPVARALAQWAVNVVDFRDRDSIMTPFKYTIAPFASGWTAKPDLKVALQSGEGLVWGCERPELLLTETLAWHDRRTEDTNRDSTAHTTTDTPMRCRARSKRSTSDSPRNPNLLAL